MKKVLSIAVFLGAVSVTFSQSLVGKWRGTCSYSGNTWLVKLQFILNADSSYSVYSFSEDHRSKVVCEVSYKFRKNNKISLEETKVIRTHPAIQKEHFSLQGFLLRISEDYQKMSGRWYFTPNNAAGIKKVTFVREE